MDPEREQQTQTHIEKIQAVNRVDFDAVVEDIDGYLVKKKMVGPGKESQAQTAVGSSELGER